MKIMIFDDEFYYIDKIDKFLIEYQFLHDLDFEIVKCQNYSDFLSQRDNVDLYLLDMEINEINGMKIANEIYDTQPHSIIVYITAHRKYALQAFGLNIYKYLTKDNLLELNSILAFCVNHFDNSGIELRSPNGKIFIYFKDILYFESSYKEIYVYTKIDEIRIYSKTLVDLLNKLPSYFILINKQTIINLDKVVYISKEKIILEGENLELKISRRKTKQVNEAYIDRQRRRID